MAKHHVNKNGIIYIIPNDELYYQYRNNETDIDKYGRLINTQTKRVVKELEQRADNRPVVVVQPREEHPIRDVIVDSAAESLRYAIERGVDWLFYDGLPYLWHNKVVPSIESLKEYKKNGGKLKCESILEKDRPKKSNTITQIATKPKVESREKTPMTEDEILDEQRKAVLHYIGLLKSLTKLHNAGVIDKNSTLEQLTNPKAIEQFNQTLAKNPNLLEMTQHIELNRLLGRDLFQSGEFVPIEIKEIESLATNKI